MIRRIVLAAVLCLPPTAGAAQVTTGLPPFGSLRGGSFDRVDNANLNVYFGIPVANKAGRGLPFYYIQAYSSSVWYPVSSNGTKVWAPVGNWGWGGITSAATGFVTYSWTTGSCTYNSIQFNWTIYNFDFYYDPNGTPHPINTSVSTWNSYPCGSGPPFSATALASDGSGYTYSVTATPSAVVYSRSGQSIYRPVGAATGNGSVYDSNGNYLSVATSSGTTTFTDTLGTTALTVSGSSASPLSLTPGQTLRVVLPQSWQTTPQRSWRPISAAAG